MVKENKKQEDTRVEQQQKTVQDLSDEQLQALAFRIGEQIKGLQRQYNAVYEEIVKRSQPKE